LNSFEAAKLCIQHPILDVLAELVTYIKAYCASHMAMAIFNCNAKQQIGNEQREKKTTGCLVT